MYLITLTHRKKVFYYDFTSINNGNTEIIHFTDSKRHAKKITREDLAYFIHEITQEIENGCEVFLSGDKRSVKSKSNITNIHWVKCK